MLKEVCDYCSAHTYAWQFVQVPRFLVPKLTEGGTNYIANMLEGAAPVAETVGRETLQFRLCQGCYVSLFKLVMGDGLQKAQRA